MKFYPLTQSGLLKGKLGNVLNKLYAVVSHETVEIEGYTLIKDITPVYSSTSNRVGIYKNNKGQEVIIKRCIFGYENLDSVYMKNEASVLEQLSKTDKKFKIAPEFIEFISRKNETMLVTKLEKGELLISMNSEIQTDVIQKVYARLNLLSEHLEISGYKNISVRNPFSYLLSFPVNFFKVFSKNPSNSFKYLKFSLLFYFNYVIGSIGGISYRFSHRDIYADNILYLKKEDNFTLLDWESAVVTDSVYDLAQIAMIYFRHFTRTGLAKFLNEHLNTNAERRRFIALGIFNGMQILGNNSPEDIVFKQTSKFMDVLLNRIKPDIMKKKSPFEIINTAVLDCIALFYKITGLPMFRKTKKIILCYHSVGDDGWRFSTKISTFESHIRFLKKNVNIVNLTDLLQKKEGGVSLSFDDGYDNVEKNALPLLNKHGIAATLFALGDGTNARRDELNNNLPLMNEKQIVKLHENGWEIGFHTYSHPNLGTLDQDELNEEIKNGKKKLEHKLGFQIRYFAYPKGIYTKQIVQTVREAGYTAAFTVDGSAVKEIITEPMLIDRVPIEGELTASQLGALISPIGLVVTFFFMKILSFKEKYLTGHGKKRDRKY